MRLKDLASELDVARTTVSDWVTDFHMFIPYVMDGRSKFYEPAALDVLREVQRLKKQGIYKADIYKELKEMDFALVVEDAAEEIKNELQSNLSLDKREDLLNMFKVAINQKQMLENHDKRFEEHERVITQFKEENDKKFEEQSEALNEIKKSYSQAASSEELNELKKENESLKKRLEKLEKPWYKKLLG
ncbi:MerR family transcriptional regulator [Halobacillus faecis]|uniref:MerR family transcriptional regulator n=1 Tax=Halobacillus faecis TaxID=360184 RepID=UPI00142EE1EE|nr:MerR family transcriptional regulator [Halobacillus faecis]